MITTNLHINKAFKLISSSGRLKVVYRRILIQMPRDDGLKQILKIIAKKSKFMTENKVFDNAIVEESGLQKEEGYRNISQLEMIGLIEIGMRPAGQIEGQSI